jgi:hypothetical protein
MARVDYDRMAPDYVEARTLPPEGMTFWREAIRPWLPTEDRSPVLDLDAVAGELRRVLRPGGPVLVRPAFPGRMEAITLYQRFFPGAAAAETTPTPVVDRIDLLVLRRSV